jgi:hypothetical protein
MDTFLKQSRILEYVIVFGLAIVFMVVLMVFLGSNATADVIVDQAGGGDYLTIQEGVDNVISGENVFVWDGSYNENITIDKSLQLIGNGSATTTIDASGLGNNAVNITAEGVELTGFNITNNETYYGIWADVGGFNIHDNIFYTQDFAIYMDINRMFSISTVIGDMIVDNNEVTGTEGFFFKIEFSKPLAGSNIVIGQTIITNNKLYNTNIGITINDYAIRDMSGGSVDWGDTVINDNLINSDFEGIYFWGWVINMTDVNVNLGNLDVSGNNITSDPTGILLLSWNTIDVFGSTVVTTQDTKINNNTIVSQYYNGINFYSSYLWYLYDSASVTTGDFFINSNNITTILGICILIRI